MVVVGGMRFAPMLILVILPVLIALFSRRDEKESEGVPSNDDVVLTAD